MSKRKHLTNLRMHLLYLVGIVDFHTIDLRSKSGARMVTHVTWNGPKSYTCSYQNEIQLALWHRQSVNIFTTAWYVKTENCRSMALATDCKTRGRMQFFLWTLKLRRYWKMLRSEASLSCTQMSHHLRLRIDTSIILREPTRLLNVEIIWKFFCYIPWQRCCWWGLGKS